MNIVITGTSRGIGKGLAEGLLSAGHVVIGLARGESTIVRDGYMHIQCDLTNAESIKKAVGEIKSECKSVGCLINNAGIASMNHFLLTPVKMLQEVFAVNVFGPFQLTRELAKLMMKEKNGRVINFSTVAVPLNLEGEAVYAASKAAVEQLTRVLARELAEFRITCNAVGPVPIKTELIRGVPQHKIERLVDRQAIKRFGEIRDVLNVVEFFMREESAMITGQVLYLGGVS